MQTRTPKVRPKKRKPKPKGKTAGKAGAANANAQVEASPTPGPSQASRARMPIAQPFTRPAFFSFLREHDIGADRAGVEMQNIVRNFGGFDTGPDGATEISPGELLRQRDIFVALARKARERVEMDERLISVYQSKVDYLEMIIDEHTEY